MRWKRVVWLGCLAPVLGGCHSAYHPPHDLVADAHVAHSESQIERHIHRNAREAWLAVRCQYPGRAFTAEFADGFVDGYTDYLDRGGDGQPPAVPPPRYTRHPKYFTPEGHALIQDYFLGFKYGTDVAVATGQRQYLTVPVLIPEPTTDAVVAVPAVPAGPAIPPSKSSDSPAPLPTTRPLLKAMPLREPRRLPSANPPPKTGIPGYHSPTWTDFPDSKRKTAGTQPGAADSGKAKSGASPPLPEPAPADASASVSVPSIAAIPTAPDPVASAPAPAPIPEVKVKAPTPRAEPLDPPGHRPYSPMVDDGPVIPPNFELPPPLPPNHPDPVRK